MTGKARRQALTAILLALALAAPFILYPVFVMEALCFALFACAFNLLIGYVGLLSFGHAAFLGSAAYITAYTVKAWGLPTELGILAGVAAAACLGAVFGWLAIRRQGIYFAMIPLALAQMVYFVALQARFPASPAAKTASRPYLGGAFSASSSSTIPWRCTTLSSRCF